jgi:hypothetical protein
MSTASTLLDRTERLQTRLDTALTKHAKTTLPRRKDAIKDSVKIGAGKITGGIASAIVERQGRVAEAHFQVPYDQATILLRHLHVILSDGTETLDQSPAFPEGAGGDRRAPYASRGHRPPSRAGGVTDESRRPRC